MWGFLFTMDRNTRIKQVLTSWDYQEAIDLLKEFSDDIGLINVLSRGENKFFRKKLHNELLSLITKEEDQYKEPEKIFIKIDGRQKQTIKIEEYPDELKEIVKRRNNAVREQDVLRGQHILLVEQNSSSEEILAISKQIIRLDDTIKDCWYHINFHYKYKQLPQAPSNEVQEKFEGAETTEDLIRIRNNYRAYITKAKKGSMPKEKLPFYEQVLQECERRIGGE